MGTSISAPTAAPHTSPEAAVLSSPGDHRPPAGRDPVPTRHASGGDRRVLADEHAAYQQIYGRMHPGALR